MTKKSKVFAIILVVIAVPLLFKVFFYYTGPVYGVVVDANTGQPIEGAIISILWDRRDLAGGGSFNVETITDKSGNYRFGGRLIFRRLWYFELIGDESVLVYKDGYAAYGADSGDGSYAGSFIGAVFSQIYTRKNNIVKLYRLPSDDPEFHARNANFFGGYGAGGPLMKKALESERVRANTKTKRNQ